MRIRINPGIRSILLIFLCFLLTSTGWLSWEYNLLSQLDPNTTDIMTMVTGYLMQAAGIGVFCLLASGAVAVFRPDEKSTALAAVILHIACLVPSVSGRTPAGTIAFGLLMNLFCGIIAGYYLYDLTVNVPGERRATAFGLGYGLAILSSWLLSLTGDRLYYSGKITIVCVIISVIAVILIRIPVTETARSAGSADLSYVPAGTGILWPAAMVALFGIVNSIGFAFPSSDIGTSVNVELSRLIYAAGLIIAGYIADRSRKSGAVLAMAALVFPFIILALRGESVPEAAFWTLGYIAFGFYAVYRVIVFSDVARAGRVYLAGAGLMIGRIGDAAGELISVLLSDHPVALVAAAAVMFVITVPVFFTVYNRLYIVKSSDQIERERFYRFAIKHDLSQREREVLKLIIGDRTNSEIAGIISISDNTVKYHVRNILQKTGCRNRKELIAVYYGSRQS